MIIGLDISTSCIGISSFTNDGQLHTLEHLELSAIKSSSDSARHLYKSNAFKEKLISIKQRYEDMNEVITHVFVEDILGGSNNQMTVIALAKMNATCCYIIHEVLGIIPNMVTIFNARKYYCPEFIRRDVQRIENEDFDNYVRDKKIKSKLTRSKLYSELSMTYKDVPLPYRNGIKEVFSYDKDLDIKQYILNKVITKYPFLKETLKYKKDKLIKNHYDEADACVIGEYGCFLIKNNYLE